MMKSLSKPYAVKTKAVENGMNYQFAFTIYVVTIHKSDGDEVGKVIEYPGELTNYSAVYNPVELSVLFNVHNDMSEAFTIDLKKDLKEN